MLVMFATENIFLTTDLGCCVKLAKSIEIVLGIAAGGSIILGLSGSAFAAGSGPSTTSQTAASVEIVKPVLTINAEVAANTAETSVSDKTRVSELSAAGKFSNEQDIKITSSSIQTNINSREKTSLILRSETPDSAVNEGSDKATEEGAASGNDGKRAQAVPATTTSASLEAEPVLTVIAGPVISQSEHRVMFNSVALAIQPRIVTGNWVEIADLATFVPSAPEQRKSSTQHPVPTQSSGVFIRLTSTLAGMTVPPFFYTPTIGFIGIKVGLMVILAVVSIFTRRNFHSFSNWTRRGGFAHTARSDVASAMFNSFFATPLNLSFVTAQPLLQSSFFDGVRYENRTINDPNALRKEE